MAFLSREALAGVGFAGFGQNVLVSDKASIYNAANIVLGDNVRIDDFCVLSAGKGGIVVGNHVHIAVFSSLIGAGRMILDDFCNLSSRVSIYSSSDDYSGRTLTNPTIPDEFKAVQHGPVQLGRHVIVGSGSVVLPMVTLGTGCAVGALSLVSQSYPEFTIVGGVPAKRIGERRRDLVSLEVKLREREKSDHEQQ